MQKVKCRMKNANPAGCHRRDSVACVHHFIFFILYPLSFILCPEVHARPGVLYLTIPTGARATAMGEAGVSSARGGSAAWWNPALAVCDRSEVAFQVFNWIGDGRGSSGAGRFYTSWGGLAVSYFNLGIGGFEIRDRPGDPQGTFTVHNTVFTGTAAVRLTRDAALGVTLKHYIDQIYTHTTRDAGVVDVGGVFRRAGWNVGVAARNLDPAGSIRDELPSTLTAGISRELIRNDLTFTGAVDWESIIDEGDYLHAGLEFAWQQAFAGRVGYIAGHYSKGLTFGVGVGWKRWQADYSLTPYSNELGTVWRLGLGLAL